MIHKLNCEVIYDQANHKKETKKYLKITNNNNLVVMFLTFTGQSF